MEELMEMVGLLPGEKSDGGQQHQRRATGILQPFRGRAALASFA